MTKDETCGGDRDYLARLIANAGLAPTPVQFEEMFDAYPYISEMLGRLQRDFGFGEEPAHVYSPRTFVPSPARYLTPDEEAHDE